MIAYVAAPVIGVFALASCAAREQKTQDGAALAASVGAIIKRSCAIQVCHGFMVANAEMDLMRDGFRAALVDVPACEYDRMARVKPGHPEQSWIMIKLSGPVHFRQYADFIDFKPDADWKPSVAACSGTFDDGAPWFGTRMPPANTTQPPSADEIETIREWIAAGAPAAPIEADGAAN
jgi:hypothetical protein